MNHDELAEELVDLDKKIKQLRRVRANASYDLEWFVKERDRIKRHLAQNERERRLMLDPLKTDAAERQLNALLDRAAAKVGEKRAGQQAANELEEFWAASERRLLEKKREENRRAWVEYYSRLTVAHLEMAKDFRRRAREMQANELKETA